MSSVIKLTGSINSNSLKSSSPTDVPTIEPIERLSSIDFFVPIR